MVIASQHMLMQILIISLMENKNMEKYKRVFLIVCDSVGCGTAPKSKDYGDEGANTIGHIAESQNGI